MHSVESAIIIHAPLAMCYRQWVDFERFPQFMSRVVSVRRADPLEFLSPERRRQLQAEDPQKDYEGVITTEVVKEVAVHGNQLWHWEIKGPLGQVFEWTAGVVMNMPNKAISWASTPEQELPTTGTVNFLKAAGSHAHTEPGSQVHHEKTLVTVTMSFSPPVGVLGEFLADVVHYGDHLLSEALEEFKKHVEVTYSLEVGQMTSAYPAEEKPMTSEAELRDALGTVGGTQRARP
jgi:uncharacterized membrane protein